MNFLHTTRRNFLGGATALLTSTMFLPSARAENLPSHVNFLIPFGEGGSFDKTCRGAAAALMDAHLVESATFENVPGEGGATGYDYLVRQKADNSDTLMLVGTSILARRGKGQFPYQVADLSMVSMFSAEVLTFSVRADSPIKSMEDLVKALKSDPASLKIASDSDPGLSEHLCAAKMLSKSGISPKSVTYVQKKGHGEHINALLAGEADVVVAASWGILDAYNNESVRVLAVSSESRVEQLPDVPTLAEAGVSDAVFYNARWFFMAPGIDPSSISAMGELLEKMVGTPEWEAEKITQNLTMLFALPPRAQDVFDEQVQDIKELQSALGMAA